MATADSVKSNIQSLITKANNKTGRTDTNMTNAVNALVSGYNPDGIIPSGTKSITTNGTHDVKNYASATVNVPVGVSPTGTVSITTNGTHDVTNYASANVNVPVPSGYIKPSGTKSITANGTHDVTSYASATVNVPIPSGYIKPTGTLSITANGTHDVTNYASTNVNVPIPSGYVKPSGTLNITANGTHTVTNYASVTVNVPTSGGGSDNYHVIPITISSDLGTTANVNHTLVSGNSFVQANYANESFFAILIPLNAGDSVQENKTTTFLYHGNRVLTNSKAAVYGVRTNGNGTSNATAQIHTSKISQSGYVVALRATSAGNLNVYVQSGYTVPAGSYLLILGLAA